MRTVLVVAGLALTATACARSAEEPPADPAAGAEADAVEAAAPKRAPTVLDPEVERLCAAIDLGRVEEARSLARGLDPGAIALPLARLSALEGGALSALRAIEAARRARPADPEVYATAAEIYAAAGKLDAAWDEIRAGDAACGEAPELRRARGVVWISRSGGAAKGLELLEQARRADPGLPFLARALGQAHLLVGKEAAAAGDAPGALAHAREAASFDPEDVDVRRFLADALAASGAFEEAVAVVEELVGEGRPLAAELALLHKRAGIAALLARERERALEHFAVARRLGLTDEELSTGARLLDEEVEARIAAGIEAYRGEDLARAEASFRGALALDADRVDAKNHLAVALFREGSHAEAAALWREVLATARKEGLALPEPVHVNLAKALALGGDEAGAREALESYLETEPDGPWAAETRRALLALSGEDEGH